MKVLYYILFVFLYLLPVTYIYAQEKSAGQTDSASTPATEEDQSDSLLYSRPDFNYNEAGKKDPFISLAPVQVDDEEKVIKGLFNFEEAQILGIINSEKDSYALVKDENELSYVLRAGDRVFGGYVTLVSEDAVYFHIVKYGRAMTIIMRLESSKKTVIEEKDGVSVVKKPGIDITYEKRPLDIKEVLIEEVTVFSPDIKTIEEEWLDSKEGKLDVLTEQSDSDQAEKTGSFFLTEPPDNSWIRLPYILDWTNFNEINVSYSIIIDDDSDFNSPIFTKEGIITSSYLINGETGLPPNKELFWKVYTIDSSGKRLSCKQSHLSFKIVGQK